MVLKRYYTLAVAKLKNKKDYLIIIRVITINCFPLMVIEVKYDKEA
jgi:hypothetical protein